MIGKINRSSDFGQTLRYVSRDDDLQPIYGSTYAANKGLGSNEIAAEMNDLAERSRSQRPCLHVSLSPEKGDDLSEFEWSEVTARWAKGMGLESNQYAVYLHHDEDYGEGEQERPHAHIVANLVGADGKQVYSAKDYYRSQLVIRDIERSMSLEQRPSSWEQTKDQEKEHDEQQQRFTEGDRELSAGAGSQQQPTRAKDRDRGGAAQAPGGDLQVEPHRSGTRQRAERGLRQDSALVDAPDRDLQRDLNLGAHHLGSSGAAPADRQSGDSTGENRAASRDDTQQQRVEETAALIYRGVVEPLRARQDEDGELRIHGQYTRLRWQETTQTLAAIEQDTEEPIFTARLDDDGQWHDLGSNLSQAQAERFQQMMPRIQQNIQDSFVDELAPQLRRELMRNPEAQHGKKHDVLDGKKNAAIWQRDSSTLTVLDKETREPIMVAQRDRDRWRNLGAQLTASQVDGFTRSLEQYKEQRRAKRETQERKPKEKELTL